MLLTQYIQYHYFLHQMGIGVSRAGSWVHQDIPECSCPAPRVTVRPRKVDYARKMWLLSPLCTMWHHYLNTELVLICTGQIGVGVSELCHLTLRCTNHIPAYRWH
ncbi:unnamed protein product [Ixodes pacificus]